jgi:hypothetical protein
MIDKDELLGNLIDSLSALNIYLEKNGILIQANKNSENNFKYNHDDLESIYAYQNGLSIMDFSTLKEKILAIKEKDTILDLIEIERLYNDLENSYNAFNEAEISF